MVARYRKCAPEKIDHVPGQLRDKGVYLITGGLGGMGLALAGYLAETLQARLVRWAYPDGLKNEEISAAARIMAVVDIYDALVTDRPYREGMSLEKAVEILNQEANNEKLDKVVVGHLIEAVSGDQQVENKVAPTN